MKIRKERRVQLVYDLPHWYNRPEIDREALRRLELKDRPRSITGAQDTSTPQRIGDR